MICVVPLECNTSGQTTRRRIDPIGVVQLLVCFYCSYWNCVFSLDYSISLFVMFCVMIFAVSQSMKLRGDLVTANHYSL